MINLDLSSSDESVNESDNRTDDESELKCFKIPIY